MELVRFTTHYNTPVYINPRYVTQLTFDTKNGSVYIHMYNGNNIILSQTEGNIEKVAYKLSKLEVVK